ncbi:MAG: FtsX-like permease family protein, partial [Terriglobales bacterium]
GFDRRDTAQSYPVAIVNQTFARRYYRGQNPVGMTFRMGGETATIVGEARNGKYLSLTESPRPYFYLPLGQHYDGSGVALAVRTRPGAAGVGAAILAQIRDADDDIPTYGPVAMTQFMGAAYFEQKVAASFMGFLAALALALAAMGLYAVSARAVAQRTREIGVRMALGARPGDVARLFLRQALKLAIWGGVLGALGALVTDRLMASMLVGVSPADPRVWAVVTGILGAVGVLAAWWPARRAARVDPQVAMRCD